MILIAGCSRSVSPLTRLTETDVILAFGDSLTYGTGVSSEMSYPSVLASRIGRTVINEGIPGELSSDGLLRLPRLLDEYQPSLVVICHGGNDFLRKQPIEQLEHNLKQMVQLARDAGAEVILVAVPQPKLLMLSDAKVYQKVANEMHVAFVDDALSDILSETNLKSDAVHPNAQGYQLLAEAIEAVLTDAKAI
ncbi:MAG TPA: arylesterase [Crenotrichaceae bacterium]|nr:arylesterase [Crenotrichaceae bacterium]